MGNRNWTKRDGGNGDVFDYDQADQAIVAKLDIANPSGTAPGSPTIIYDGNGNRNSFAAYGPVEQYSTDEFSRHPSRKINGVTTNAAYDGNSNMTGGLDGSSYAYDAQNRLTSASKGTTTMTFAYDGLNRQVSRTVGAATTYNIYDGWDLIAEYAPGATTPSEGYLHGAGGIVKNLVGNKYYYQDASGSTSHLAGGAGALVEWYRYDLQGTPIFYNANDVQKSKSGYGVRHLFTAQQWYSDIGLYDLRNRYYSPDIGRFLQADPIGFRGGKNLYRYCGNNPLKWRDPIGLVPEVQLLTNGPFDAANYGAGPDDRVNVTEPYLPAPGPPSDPVAPPGPGTIGGGSPGSGELPESHIDPSGNIHFFAPIRRTPPLASVPQQVDPSQVQMVDNEDQFSPSDWSDTTYSLQWSLSYEGNIVSTGSISGITPREAYRHTREIGFATASRRVPGSTIRYDFVTFTPSGFVYNGWSVTATVMDPWGIDPAALQVRLSLQAHGVIPAGLNLAAGGGLSSFLYGQLPTSIQYNGYYYAVPTDE